MKITARERQQPYPSSGWQALAWIALKAITDGIREDFGYPARLINLLSSSPQVRVTLDEPTPCICAKSVPLWHELGTHSVLDLPRRERGALIGWRLTGGCYWESFEIERPEYALIGHRDVIPEWTCDITDIHGFSASKSNLCDFTSTDQMVETNSREMIDQVSLEKLAKNLAHRQIRIIHSPETSDHFTRYLWDGRLWLMNSGGSHHFAAAKYIAARLGQPVSLTGRLYTYSLNASAIASLRHEFEMFVINDETTFSNAFFDAMRTFKATWLWHPMPRPYERTQAILLPRSEARSVRVAAEFRKAGIFDFGAYLATLAAKQSTHC